MNNPNNTYPYPPSWYAQAYHQQTAWPGSPTQQTPPQYMASMPNQIRTSTGSSFLQGALIGAAAAYLLTNDSVQQTAIKSAVKTWTLIQGGMEEMKERFRDAEAELHASQMGD